MQLSTREGGGHIVAALSGELDAVNAADGVAAITAIMTPGQCLIVDMTALEFIDCCALRALLAVREVARQEGGDLLLAGEGLRAAAPDTHRMGRRGLRPCQRRRSCREHQRCRAPPS